MREYGREGEETRRAGEKERENQNLLFRGRRRIGIESVARITAGNFQRGETIVNENKILPQRGGVGTKGAR